MKAAYSRCMRAEGFVHACMHALPLRYPTYMQGEGMYACMHVWGSSTGLQEPTGTARVFAFRAGVTNCGLYYAHTLDRRRCVEGRERGGKGEWKGRAGEEREGGLVPRGGLA